MDGTISQLADQLINQVPLYTLDRTNTTSNAPPPKAEVYGWWFPRRAADGACSRLRQARQLVSSLHWDRAQNDRAAVRRCVTE